MKKLQTWTAVLAILAAASVFTPALRAQQHMTREEVSSLPLAGEIPSRGGTYWVWNYGRSNTLSMMPLPLDPFGSEVPVYSLDGDVPGGGRHFLVDNGPDDLTLGQQGQLADQALRSLEGRLGMDSPAPLDDTITPQGSTQDSLIDTNQLWLTIAPLTNQLAYVELHATVQDQTYQLESTESLTNPITWSPEGAPFVGLQGLTPVVVPVGSRTNSLFLRALSWVDDDGNGIPDWWEIQFFGTNGIDPYSMPANDGWTVLQKYQNGWNPTQFCTPPAPQAFTGRYYSANNSVALSWIASPGPVSSYTVDRHVFSLDEFDSYNLPAATTSFTNALPPGSITEHSDPPSYQLTAHYAGGDSPVRGPIYVPGSVLSSSAATVLGAQGRLYLMASALPANVATIRVYRQNTDPAGPQNPGTYPASYEANFLWEDPQPFTSGSTDGWFDVPVSALSNGCYQLPVSQAALFGCYWFYLQGISADGALGAKEGQPAYTGVSDGSDRVVPFLDGRRQIQQNIEFLLRAAKGHDTWYGSEVPFDLWYERTVGGWGVQCYRTQDPNYVFAGFHFPDYGQELLRDPFQPFEQNNFLNNFVYSPTNVNPSGWFNTGGYIYQRPFDYPFDFYAAANPTNLFSTYNYASGRSTGSIPAVLSYDSSQWILLTGAETAVLIDNTNSTWTVPTGFRNVYGLPLTSVKWLRGIQPLDPVDALPGDNFTTVTYGTFFEMARPQLSTTNYYFARCGLDPQPGEPAFQPNLDSTPLVIPFGQHAFLTAWAKQAIRNGYTDKFAFAEQYFDQALKIDASGAPTTNHTGILSEYGEFFPTEPGPVALVTMPDIDTGQRGTGVVNVIKLQLDANHDGTMDLTFGGPDNTAGGWDWVSESAVSHPYVFWINNDRDIESYSGDPGEDKPVNYPFQADFNQPGISSQRDLEDFARLWICGMPALTNGGYQVTLSWDNVSSGTPAINLVNAVETNGGTLYLTASNTAAAQCANYMGYGPGEKYRTISATNAPLTLPSSLFTNAGNKYFLFEGAGIGCGELVLTITQNGTNVLAQTGAWLDLHDVKDFYERAVITNTVTGAISNWTSAVETVQCATASALGDEPDIIVLVHGINVDDWHWANASETVLKRLYWSGYHGEFATVKWQCNYLTPPKPVTFDVFNLSEAKAYKDSTALAAYLNQLHARFPDHRLHLLVHSQGNAVVSEALARSGVPVDTYILTQGALPASAYDVNAPTNADLWSYETNNPTPEWQPMGYHGAYTNLTGRIVNFYNPQDGVLKTWVTDQELDKPSAHYWFNGTDSIYTYFTTTYTVSDPQESRAMVSRSRTLPIGQSGPASGHGVIQSAVDLRAQFDFNDATSEHSAQWTRPIQTSRPYFQQVLTSCQLVPAP